MSTLKVNQIEPRTGGDVTIGESGGTVTLADGATAVGFGPDVPEYPVSQVRAWCFWHQTGTQSIYGSENISSITDLGVGITQLNFTNAMPDANYSAPVTASPNYNDAGTFSNSGNKTTTSFKVTTTMPFHTSANALSTYDAFVLDVIVVR